MEMHLYVISHGIAQILGEEEWTEETESRLEKLELALEAKVENIVKFCATLGAFTAAAKAEEERISARRRTAEARVAKLKAYMKQCLEQAERTEVIAGTHKVTIQNNPPSVEIETEWLIPPRYNVIIPESFRIDKKAIADALKKGEEVPGAKLVRGTSLRIK
jgi:hypothetical protein